MAGSSGLKESKEGRKKETEEKKKRKWLEKKKTMRKSKLIDTERQRTEWGKVLSEEREGGEWEVRDN